MKSTIYKVYEISRAPYVEVKKVWEGEWSWSFERLREIRSEISRKIRGGVSRGRFYIHRSNFVAIVNNGFPSDLSIHFSEIMYIEELSQLLDQIKNEEKGRR